MPARSPWSRRSSWRWSLEPLGDEVRRELDRHGPQAGMGELVDRWPDAVGPAIARHAWPARIGRDGTVHVNTADSIWAFELGQRTREVAEKLGVDRVRFAPGPLPEPEPPTRLERLEPSVADQELARALAASIADEKLRETVQKAVSLSLARGRPGRRI